MKDDHLYLIHITECLERIEQYTTEGATAFFSDTRTQDAVLRNLQVMAESTQHLSAELKAAHPAVAWRSIAGFRNVLVHDYLGVNLVRVWEVIEQYIPTLKQEIARMQQDLGPSP